MARTVFVNRLIQSSLALSTLVEMLLPFVRSIALARLLPADQVGLGVTISVVFGIAEQSSDIGINFSAVKRSELGTSDEVSDTLHSLQLMRGAALGGIIIAASPLLAGAFSAPEATWAYMLLGVSIFLRSFANLGTKEAMRSYVFWREAIVVAGSQCVWTAVTFFLAWEYRDFRAAIFGIMLNLISYVVISHLLSPRRWRLGWHKEVAEDVIAFGRPLMPNGMANAFIQLADRFVVGSVLGVAPLAFYNITMVTALLPRNAVAKFLNTIFLPVMVNAGKDGAASNRVFDVWTLVLVLPGFAYAIGLMSIGPIMIDLIFGSHYRPTSLVMGLVAINICGKFADQLPIPAALAFGQTRFIFFGTIASAAGVALAIAVLLIDKSFDNFMIALAAGEALAVVWITANTIRMFKFVSWLTWLTVLTPIAVLTCLLVLEQVFAWSLGAWIAITWTVGALTIIGLVATTVLTGVNPRTVMRSIKASRLQPEESGAGAVSAV